MTPNEILNKKFGRSPIGGYKIEEVNAFVLSVSDSLEKTIGEKAELQKKLVVLADSLESYRSDEESMRSALLGAQKLGDSILKDSNDKADKLMEDAIKESESIVSNAKNEATKITHTSKLNLETEKYTLNTLQREVAKFKKQILALYQQQVELISAIPYDESSLAPQLPNPLKSNIAKKKEAEDNISGLDAKALEGNNGVTKEDGYMREEITFEALDFGNGFKVEEE